MNVLLFVAVIAVSLAVGGWIGVRYTEARQKLDADIARFLLVADGQHRMYTTGLIADLDEFDRDRWRWGR